MKKEYEKVEWMQANEQKYMTGTGKLDKLTTTGSPSLICKLTNEEISAGMWFNIQRVRDQPKHHFTYYNLI